MGARNYKKPDGSDRRSQRGRRIVHKERTPFPDNPFGDRPQKIRFLKGGQVKQEQLQGVCHHFGQRLSEVLDRKIEVVVYDKEYKNIIGGLHMELEYEFPQLMSFGVYIHWEAATGKVLYVGKAGIPLVHRVIQGLGRSKSRLLAQGDFSECRWVKRRSSGYEVIENGAFDTTLLAINAEGVAHSTKESAALAAVLEVCVLSLVGLLLKDMKGVRHNLPPLNVVQPKLSTVLANPGFQALLGKVPVTSDVAFCLGEMVTRAYHDAKSRQ